MHKDYQDAVEPILRAYELVKNKGPQSRNYMYVYSQLALLHLPAQAVPPGDSFLR